MRGTQIDITPAEAAREAILRGQAHAGLVAFCQYTKDDYQLSGHLEQLANKLEAVERGEITRLMVIMPPRHGKSELVSLRFPCWYLGRNPGDYIVQSGYSESIALVHSRKARDIFVSADLGHVFPQIRYRPERVGQETIIPERQAAHEWGTKRGGSYYAVGVGGGLTGRGFDIGIIDDPVKDAEEANSITYRDKVWEWYTQVFRTRAHPGARIILVMTRWHYDDLAGRLLQQAKIDPGADQWDVLHLPAIDEDGQALWPDRYSIGDLERIKLSIGSRAFESLYQGRPSAVEGNIIKREWWQYYSAKPSFTRIIHSWDTAFKKGDANDYSVCTVWGETPTGLYLIDVFRERIEFPELKRVAAALYNRDRPSAVLIEDKASGQSLIQELGRSTRIPLLPIKTPSDKITRANSATPLIEAGKVFLPRSAPWLYDYIEEMQAFPNGIHDDQVDSTTQFINWIGGKPIDDLIDDDPRDWVEDGLPTTFGIRGKQF